jgi:hypothetical protein
LGLREELCPEIPTSGKTGQKWGTQCAWVTQQALGTRDPMVVNIFG